MTETVPAKRLERERKARLEAERLLEEKSRELYRANEELKILTEGLEKKIATRTMELKQARDDALKESSAKSRFIAVMSHEVRNPLNGVIGALGLLRESVLGSDQREFVEAARKSASALLVIINDILDYSKIDADKLKLEPVIFDLRELISSVLVSYNRSSPSLQGPVRLYFREHNGLPAQLVGDIARLRQVLINLVDNAVKFTEKGEIEVSAALEESSASGLVVSFSVRDTGHGIPESEQPYLFEEFWSRSAKQQDGIVGTGMGLSIASRLVTLMGGEIKLESEPGRGSVFRFSLPFKAPSDTELLEYRSNLNIISPPNYSLSGRVLLAEDNSSNQLIISKIISNFGVTADVVSNGLEAVDSIKNRLYDLILMDIDMPEMDGIEATRKIKEFLRKNGSEIPVIAVTAYALPGDREKFLSRGFDDYLVKPIDRSTLGNCLERWLRKRNAHAGPSVLHADQIDSVAGESLVDIPTLDKLTHEVGNENMGMLIQVFVDELKTHKKSIERAASEGDLGQLGSAAHSLKSSAASFGAFSLSDIARKIEQSVTEGDAPGIKTLSVELCTTADAVQNQLQAIVKDTA